MGAFYHPTLLGFFTVAFFYFIFLLLVFKDLGFATIFLIISCFVYGLIILPFGLILTPVLGFIRANPLLILASIGAYTLFGVFIAIIKWKSFSKVDYNKLPSYHNATSKDLTEEQRIVELYDLIPKAGENKVIITRWISIWPLFVLEFVFSDMVRKFFRFVAESTEKLFNKVSMSENAELVEKYKQIKSLTKLK